MASPLGQAVEFLQDFGFFDVVLPFLLTFTLTFAILEKTQILGTTKVGKKDDQETIPNKNLNAMVSFVFGLLVVATANVVRAINESLPNIVLLVVISVSFLILIGTFIKDPMDFTKKGTPTYGWYIAFIIIMFIGVVLIFLNSIYFIYQGDEVSVLEYAIGYAIKYWSGAVVGSIVILGVLIAGIIIVTKSGGGSKNKGGD
ncbi:hypothetical protein J4425_00825 [Candidatus Woesearchaeota archaeon]|nr:hypothetical protein [Candidatus Woesearchaeota archaeon]